METKINELSNAAAIMGRKGGKSTTPAKQKAVRLNGRLGGRPRSLLNKQSNVKNCSIIYAPRGKAGEYAPLATNPYRGCGHRCVYCYVPQVLRMDRAVFNAGAVERPNFLEALKKDAKKYQDAGVTEQVLLSFTTDPYHPGNTSLTRAVIKTLVEFGFSFCTLTKGGSRALRDIDLFRKDKDAFASTLTSLDAAFSRRWEPGAALPDDRITALKAFHSAGVFTWVSLEPTLDVESSLEIIEKCHGFVDLFKIGKANYIPQAKTIDWRDYTMRVVETCQRLGIRHYIKHDLQPYLPAGYKNVMRQDQHN